VIVAVIDVGDCVGLVFGDGETDNNTATINYDASNNSTVIEGEKYNSIVDQYNRHSNNNNNNNNNNNGCDESKCVSTGLSGSMFNDSFTCYIRRR
jgi:hypothetical protein